MNEPIKSEVLEKMLLRLIRLKYPDVAEVKIDHSIHKLVADMSVLESDDYSYDEIIYYSVGIVVSYDYWKKLDTSNFLPYIHDLCKYIVARPDVMTVTNITY